MTVWITVLADDRAWPCKAVVLSHNKLQENSTHLLTKNHLKPWPLSMGQARGYGDHYQQEAMTLDWACAAQGWQLHHKLCNPLDPRGKEEAWSTEDNLEKNCGSRNGEHEPQLDHHPEAGQRQAGVEELRCWPIRQLVWWVVMMMLMMITMTSWCHQGYIASNQHKTLTCWFSLCRTAYQWPLRLQQHTTPFNLRL